jgi:hypothetical protein
MESSEMRITSLAALLFSFAIVNAGQAQPIATPCTGWCAVFVPFTGEKMIIFNKDWQNLQAATTFLKGRTPEALFLNPTDDKHLMIITYENRTYWTHLTNDEICTQLPWASSDIVPLLTNISCDDRSRRFKPVNK